MVGGKDTLVSLHPVRDEDEALLANLLQLYVHDLSAVFTQVELGEDGRYPYPALRSYFTSHAERRAFVVRVERHLAGFVLARRGSPALPDDPNVWDVAEFFVLRRFRREGVGRAAALALWEQLGGTWTVRVAHKNVGALSFWRRVITSYPGVVRELTWSPGTEPWLTFHLQSEQ